MKLTNKTKDERGFTLLELIEIPLLTVAAAGFIYLGVQSARALNKYINEPVEQRLNVRGGTEPELFIDRHGRRFYAEVDGNSIDQYLDR